MWLIINMWHCLLKIKLYLSHDSDSEIENNNEIKTSYISQQHIQTTKLQDK